MTTFMFYCEVHMFNSKLTQLHIIGVFWKEMQQTGGRQQFREKAKKGNAHGEDQIEILVVESDSASLSTPENPSGKSHSLFNELWG